QLPAEATQSATHTASACGAGSVRSGESVADAPHRFYALANVIELLAESQDVGVDGAGVQAGVLGAPHGIEEVVAREGSARVAHKQRQQVELFRRQIDQPRVHAHGVLAGVDAQAAVLQ